MRLTKDMLNAMLTALAELIAGEGPQGFDGEEADKIVANAHKAHRWIHEELQRRDSTVQSV